ncbi:MAG: hypothetical protein A3A00_00330 [Candidatus Spechtbacteria bacterium RIFCSPLOWO2_01_FULL_38_20]|nr:MAG: hypothetical protein A2728_02845 [Candidatus Spechtbacteria bacterium RIFCSPHIGHO2_01_FULL_38_11]OGZ59633.1 MAG: hypothetical protein A3A00_00330 [Candidatus Spechtbacteria bacterium RIFCSPLOWO2_01_FULL_38_20]OGZ60023.1 MAG: hypothetical protein A3E58_01605 [Candidatus Spechtbacteria bacterium RIFCSPHIGHO2_12_FULL_38_30]
MTKGSTVPKGNVKIFGGFSFPKKITVVSNKFRSLAKYNSDTQKIETTVKPLSDFQKKLINTVWLPRTLRNPILVYGLMWFALFGSMESSTVSLVRLISTVSFFTLGFWFISKRIAKWHGAEHMTIEAYLTEGDTSTEGIKKYSPINKRCGGRFLLPWLMVVVVFNFLNLGNWFITLGIVTILELDRFIPMHKVPVFRQASYLLQKYITTKEPNERELLTAQKAMLLLIEAHEELEQKQQKSL